MKKFYNWGILGPGKIAAKFATALKSLDNANIYAIGSRSYDRAKDFGKQFDAERYYGNYLDLVKDNNVDIIYIATPHSEHFENTRLCLQNRKNVLCEKPITTNAKQLEELLRISREKNLFLMEAIWTRFLPSIEKVLEIIESGSIGEIRMLQSDFGFKAPYDPESRLFNPALSGGSLLDIGIYPLFLGLLLLGEPEECRSLALKGETGVDESIAMSLLYDNDAMALLSSTFKVKTGMRADIFCTKGNIFINPPWFSQTSLNIEYLGGKTDFIEFDYRSNGYDYEAEEVMRCLDMDLKGSPKLPLSFSLKLMNLMDMIRKQNDIEYPADFY